MSLFNSVLGSLSPKFRSSFEDAHAPDYELPLYKSPPLSPRIPPPIASTVMWTAPSTSLSPPPRVPDDLLALQRRARHLEQQLQELLDAQADGLMSGMAGNGSTAEDLVSNGSTTPTVSSVRGYDRSAENEVYEPGRRKKKIGLGAARRGIFRRIQQLASVKAEEMDLLDDNLRDLEAIVQKTEVWRQKRSRLEKKIHDIEGESAGTRTQTLQSEATKLEQEIRRKEEELWALKTRHRRVLSELADTENSMEAKLATYKASLSILDKEISTFLSRPLDIDYVPLSPSPFLSLSSKRRTLEMAHDYWQDEHTRLSEKCQEVDIDRAALDEGAVLWKDVVRSVDDFETSLQSHMQRAARSHSPDSSKILAQMETTIRNLEERLEIATSRSWNLLVCAVGAELEAFKQGKDILEEALRVSRKGEEKAVEMTEMLVDTESSHAESEEEGSSSAIRISRSPPKQLTSALPKFFDTDDEDPDPELMISHQDTDTD